MSDLAAVALVIGVWGLLIWAGVAGVHYLADDHGPVDKGNLVGVRGWLTVLIGGLIAWGPLIGVSQRFQELSQAERLYPALRSLPDWTSYKSFIWILVAIFTFWQVHVGWRLCRERGPSVVAYLKKFLLVSPIAMLTFGIPQVLVLNLDYPFAEVLPGVVAVAIVNAVWFWYLSKSKRISKTYNLYASTNFQTPNDLDGLLPKHHVSTSRPNNSNGLLQNASTDVNFAKSVSGTNLNLDTSDFKSVEGKISQHRLERVLGNTLDEALYSKCLADCEFDQLRATALYKRLEAGLNSSE